MKNKILLLDIDHTILDLTKSKKYLINKLKNLLKNTKSFIENTVDVLIENNTKENKVFNPYKLINDLINRYSIKNKKKIKNIVWAKERFINSLYPDVIKFIEKIYKKFEIIIFSQGFIKFQRRKLAGIEKFINRKNIFIFKDKKVKLNRILNKFKNKKIFIIDDSPDIINLAKGNNKNIIAILMKRKNGKKYLKIKENLADHIVKDLKSAYKIIKTY